MEKIVIVFLDDILIYSKIEEDMCNTWDDTSVEKEPIVCQVEKVHFLSDANQLFWPHCLKGGHSNGS
jgi:hypothetical protein